MSETVYRCPQCGGNVQFNPGQQALSCPYCSHNIQIENLRKPAFQREIDFLSALETFESLSTEELRVVKCQACGAETTFTANADSGPCDFCGTAIVATGPTAKAMKPQYLLPFKVTMDQAEAAFRTWLKKRWFAPSALKKLARIEDTLKGIYFPYWTYDAETETRYTGERGEHYQVEVREKDSNGNEVVRTETRTRWFPVAGTVSRFFDDILVPASRSLPEELTTFLASWELKDLVEYHPALLSGFKSESYSVGLKDGFGTAQGVMEDQIGVDVRHAIGGDEQRVHSMQTRYWDITFKYIQLPVWSLTYRFKQKFYQVVVNGQTAEVAGKRPWSVLKILLAVAIGLAVVAAGVIVYLQVQ
jgi:DNA-directed RNA polymerase subunit RPC12/RpoP